MQLTLEISMYPLQEGYRNLIKEFIDKLNEYDQLDISTSHTSTLVIGEYQHLMKVFTELMAWSVERHGRSVFMAKFIPDYDPR